MHLLELCKRARHLQDMKYEYRVGNQLYMGIQNSQCKGGDSKYFMKKNIR
jgi:hypothetical protein